MAKDIHIPGLLSGVNRGQARELIDPTQATDIDNMMIVDGVLQKRTGYAAMAGSGMTGTPFYGGYHFQDGASGNTKRFWAIVGGKAWIKETLAGDWTDKTNSMTIQTGADQYVKFTEIPSLTDYHNHLIVCQNHNNPVTANNGTGTPGACLVWHAPVPEGNLAALAGGDGYNDSNVNHRAKQAIEFADHLLLLNTYEEYAAGTWGNFFYRVRYSTAGNFTTSDHWDNAVNPNAGYKDLRSRYGAIMHGEPLGSSLAIYLQKAIYMCYHTKSSTNPFQIIPKIAHIGLLAPRMCIGVLDRNYFVSNDNNIYAYYGGRDLVPIGDPIRTEFFGDMNKTYSGVYRIKDRGFAIHFKDIQCIGFAIPTGSNTSPDTIYVYDYRKKRWIDKWTFADDMTGWGEWEAPGIATAMNMPILGDDTAVSCLPYQFDYTSAVDNDTAISCAVITKEFVINLKDAWGITSVFFEAKAAASSSAVTVEISVDGAAWVGSITKTLTTTWNSYSVHFNVSGYSVRIRFRDATSGKRPYLGSVKVVLGESSPTNE